METESGILIIKNFTFYKGEFSITAKFLASFFQKLQKGNDLLLVNRENVILKEATEGQLHKKNILT